MGANRRIKSLEGFGWVDADIGAECTRCGWTRVFCAFEAARCFRERRWSTELIEATRRLRCPCFGEVRLIPVPIGKRPKPIPPRSAALRPIYREEGRLLARRGPSQAPDKAAIERH